MYFKNRKEAGKLLARTLSNYQNRHTIVYAIPRGGVIVGKEVASFLHVPLRLILTKKIGSPYNSEYAIAAVSESGFFMGSKHELADIDSETLQNEVLRQKMEIIRRKKIYKHGQKNISPRHKTVILVDDGIATGLSIRVGIAELKAQNPKEIVVAVPVASESAVHVIEKEVNDFVALEIPADKDYLGAVGGYYKFFPQISDEEIIEIIGKYEEEYKKRVRKLYI